MRNAYTVLIAVSFVPFLFSCKKEILPPPPVESLSLNIQEAKSWLRRQETFLNGKTITSNYGNSVSDVSLRWDEAVEYQYKNKSLVSVPLRGETRYGNRAVQALFSKDSTGAIKAVIKQMSILPQKHLQSTNPNAYFETILSLSGKLLANYVKQGKSFKRLTPALADKTKQQTLSEGCTIY